MCVYECTEKPFDGWVETLVKHEVHRYLSTSEWINAASLYDTKHDLYYSNYYIFNVLLIVLL